MSFKITRTISNLAALFQYPKIKNALGQNRNLFFFFPSWSFGGAERVHIDILNLFKDRNPLCLITERSKSEGFRKEFESAAEVVELGRWAEKKNYKAHLHKRLARTINAQPEPVVFGWGSRFMYDLIPFLDPHVRVIDLIHNFTDDGDGIEFYSLPYVTRIEKRILVAKSIVHQFEELYKAKEIPEHFLGRLQVIHNKIAFNNDLPKKNYNGVLKVLFVSRNSPEKRPDVFIKTAKLCYESNLQTEFQMIGDFDRNEISVPPNTEIVGEVHDQAVLTSHYAKAHLLMLSSYRESWGLVVFEGMKYGVVPIVTNVGELSTYLSIEQQNGLIVPNLIDEDALALVFKENIEFFCENRQALETFSNSAFKTMKKLTNNNSEFDNSYKKLLST